MNFKTTILVISTSIFSALFAITGYQWIADKDIAAVQPTFTTSTIVAPPAVPANYNNFKAPSIGIDFTAAADVTTPGVVHIVSTTESNPNMQEQFFFGPFSFGMPPQGPSKSSGSGVIISPDGYIVTNNHVINGASTIEVITSDNETITAEVIGVDESTDIALVKVDRTDLPHLNFANSDSVKIGSWVLAVGNPFNLSSTVTAGIVSAKGRNINILEGNTAIESFIQTDAAINPGNSGGALVDLSGNLIGINTAIASPTGSYAGYGFAVPSNLVYKVVQDLRDYGIVQRGYLGVSIRNIDTDLAQSLEINDIAGVYVENVLKGSAADDAGLRAGDIIKKINGVTVKNTPTLQETVAGYRPGDNLSVEYMRKGKLNTANVTLKNKNMELGMIEKKTQSITETLGVAFDDLTTEELHKLNIRGGVLVTDIFNGTIAKNTDMDKGFVITSVDKQSVKNKEQLLKILESKTGGIMVEGFYPGYPGKYYYAFGL